MLHEVSLKARMVFAAPYPIWQLDQLRKCNVRESLLVEVLNDFGRFRVEEGSECNGVYGPGEELTVRNQGWMGKVKVIKTPGVYGGYRLDPSARL